MKRFLLFLSVVFLGLGIAVAQEPQTVTITYSALGLSNNADMTKNPTTVSDIDGVKFATITYAKNNGADVPKFNTNDAAIRFYAQSATARNGNSMTISVEEATNIKLTKVVFTTATKWATSEAYASIGTFTDGTWNAPENEAVKTLTIQNKANSQRKIQSVAITYIKEVAGPKDYEQTFADMTLEVGESKVINLGEEHPETFVIDAEDAAIAEVVEAEGVFTVTGKAVGTTKVSVMWEGEGWNGGETEFNVTVNPVLPAPELSFDKAEITEYIGSLEQDLPVLTATEGLKITYSSSNEAVATVNPETGGVSLVAAGTTTITATSEATAEYKAGEASYILNVKAAPTGGYALLTNIDDLDGKQGLIVGNANGTYYGAGDINDKNKLAGVSVNVENDAIAEKGNCIEFTFTKTGDATYTLQNSESSYLAKGSGSTDLAWSTNQTSATVSIDGNTSQATISFTSGRRIRMQEDKNGFRFGSYSNSANDAGGDNWLKYYSLQIYVAQPAAEVVVPNMVVDGEENAEPVIVFHEGMTIHFNIPEGVRVYRRFVATEEPATPAPARVTGEDGNEYERHTEAYTVPGYGTLSYFAESQGVRSAVKEVRVSDTTGVEDITVGGEEGEAVYYDMTGRRVANPTAGLYIRVNGSTATKVYLR